jgi:hypothetical protein
LGECDAGGSELQPVKFPDVGFDQPIQVMRDGKDGVKIIRRQHPRTDLVEPGTTSLVPASRAVAIVARVIRRMTMSTVATLPPMASQRAGPAVGQRHEDTNLLIGKFMPMLLQIVGSVATENLLLVFLRIQR